RSYAGRLLVSTFWFSVITLAAVYSGNLVAFLASSDRTTPFTNLEDVAQQTDYQIGTAEGGSPEMLLRVGPSPGLHYKQICPEMKYPDQKNMVSKT
ncbi:hypothetical protein CAPTEDRAFT_138591, partial [Capitella teleta]